MPDGIMGRLFNTVNHLNPIMPNHNVVSLPLQSQEAQEKQEETAAYEPQFADFYALYPRHIARKEAARAWARLTPDQQRAAVVALVDWRRVWEWEHSRREDFTNFIPYPASWLNGERWEDELPIQFRRRHVGQSNDARVGDVGTDQQSSTGVGGLAPPPDKPRTPLPDHVLAAIAKLRKGATQP